MLVGVAALHYQQHTTECHNSHKHSQSPLTSIILHIDSSMACAAGDDVNNTLWTESFS